MPERWLASGIGWLPSDEALLKPACLALQNISRKWATLISDLEAALDRFIVQLRSGCRSINKFRLHKNSGRLPKKGNEPLLKIKAYLLAHEKIENGYCVYG
jgi:hypothetical protein